MGNGNKKKKKKISGSGSDRKKKKRSRHMSAFRMSCRRRNYVRRRFYGELKDMTKLSCNDEAFHLSWLNICDIIQLFKKHTTPTPETYSQWDEYAQSFYLKMCTCFGVDYQHLEAQPPCLSAEQDKEQVAEFPKSSPEPLLFEADQCTQPPTKDKSYEELLYEEENLVVLCSGPIPLEEPFTMGSYSTNTRHPDRIPYHLYLLVKEAVDIMKSLNNTKDLLLVEKKISFFCTYFHSHLPVGWNYNRDNANSLIDGYDTMGGPKYLMDGYTPLKDWAEAEGFDPKTSLEAKDIIDVMSIIHSRKTPSFWKMSYQEIRFYCKLCSCFGLDYHCLEAASEDDVCLMNMGRSD